MTTEVIIYSTVVSSPQIVAVHDGKIDIPIPSTYTLYIVLITNLYFYKSSKDISDFYNLRVNNIG